MTVRTFQQDGVSIFQISGELNISTSPELKKIFERDPAKKIVVDLEKVTYIDSSGLATLVEILKKTRARGGGLGLSALSEKVRSLFEITKLDKLFLILPNQEEAVAKVR